MEKDGQIRVRGAPRKDIDVTLFIQALLLACRDIEEQEQDEVRTPPASTAAHTPKEAGQ